MTNWNWLPNADAFPKKNALTPIGAFAFGIFATAVGGALYLGESVMAWVLLAIGFLPVAATIWGFQYFAKKDADRLQTEDYRIQREIVARIDGLEKFEGKQVPPRDSKPVPRMTSGVEDHG